MSRALAGTVGIQAADGIGTGFLADFRVVTAAHVVAGSDHVTLSWGDGQTSGEVVRRDPILDLAIIATQVPEGHEPLALDLSPELGEPVTVVAVDPFDGPVLTRGIVSALPTEQRIGMIQIDAAVNPGTSGGPILGQDGRVLGVVTTRNPVRDDAGRGHRADDVARFLASEPATTAADTPTSADTSLATRRTMPPAVPLALTAALLLLLGSGTFRSRRVRQSSDIPIRLGPERPVPDPQKDDP